LPGAAARLGRAAAPQNTIDSHSETLCIKLVLSLRQKGDTTAHLPHIHHNKKVASPGDGSLFCTGSLTQVGACIPYLAGKSREKAKKGFVFSIGRPFAQGVGKKMPLFWHETCVLCDLV
jgi:hypothetical protein